VLPQGASLHVRTALSPNCSCNLGPRSAPPKLPWGRGLDRLAVGVPAARESESQANEAMGDSNGRGIELKTLLDVGDCRPMGRSVEGALQAQRNFGFKPTSRAAVESI
jgi:hypothetical protein